MFAMSSERALIESARTEILLYDKEGARVDRIAERAGVNKRMIYHHFGSKEGVYQAILQRQLYLLSVASGPMPNILRLVCDSYLSEIGNAWVEKQIFQQAELSVTTEDYRVAAIICLRAFLSLETLGSMESSQTLIYIKDVSEILKKVRKTIRLIPEIKTNVIQDKKMSNVCPISGWIISKKDTGTITIKLRRYL